MAKITNAHKGFHLKIKSLYDTEKALEAALPKMAEASVNPELKQGFLEHLKETEGQSKRLEKIFEMIEATPEKHALQTIRGLVADGDEVAAMEAPDALRDAMLAGAGRDVEHYEMACYMNAIEEAKALGMDEAVSLLEETLAEEKLADAKLMMAVKNNLSLAQSEETEEAA